MLEGMWRVSIVAWALLAGCGEETEAERLRHACELNACPAPAPEYIDCMPIVPDEWAPLCADPCMSFLRDTCHIKYTF